MTYIEYWCLVPLVSAVGWGPRRDKRLGNPWYEEL